MMLVFGACGAATLPGALFTRLAQMLEPTAAKSILTWQLFKEIAMSSTTDKIKGSANEAAGHVRQAAGRALDNREERAKGALQEAKGKAQVAKGDAKDAVKKAVDRT